MILFLLKRPQHERSKLLDLESFLVRFSLEECRGKPKPPKLVGGAGRRLLLLGVLEAQPLPLSSCNVQTAAAARDWHGHSSPGTAGSCRAESSPPSIPQSTDSRKQIKSVSFLLFLFPSSVFSLPPFSLCFLSPSPSMHKLNKNHDTEDKKII